MILLLLLALGGAALAVADSDAAQKPAVAASKPFHARIWFCLPAYALAAFCVWLALLYFLQDDIFFPVDMIPSAAAEPHLGTGDMIEIETDAGKVEAYFVAAVGASGDTPAPLVLYFHGNAELMDHQRHIVEAYQRRGMSTLLVEYRGYGRSAGKPSQEAIVADSVRFYDEMIKRPEVDKARIIFHGRSLGGGIAAQVAARRAPAAMILETTFYSAQSIAARYGAPGFLSRHPFRTDRVVARLDIPLLISHGSLDRIVPTEHGRRLKELALNAKYVEYACDHNDFPGPENVEDYNKRIDRFLRSSGIMQETRP